MADNLKAALESKLVAYESAGMGELAARVRARIAQMDKIAKSEAAETAKPVAKKSAAKKTAKKTTKKR